VASRLVRDVGDLLTGAAKARQRVATFAIDGEVRFASAADRAAFAEELAAAVAALVGRHHDPRAAKGRDHRVVVAVHPSVRPERKEPSPMRLAVLPGTTHITLVRRVEWLSSMVGEFLDAEDG
jgi:hypothetical protein